MWKKEGFIISGPLILQNPVRGIRVRVKLRIQI